MVYYIGISAEGRGVAMICSYSDFSRVYDKLISDVDYSELCNNMLELCEKYSHKPSLVLDAACGTGNFTKELEKRGFDVIGVDRSSEMLSVAQQKLLGNTRLVCQDLCELQLFGMVDTVFCTLDSLNHITDYEQFAQAVKSISSFIQEGGLMIFDVNTVYKHKEVLGDNVFVSEEDDIYMVWENTLLEKNTVNINLDFFVNEKDEKYTRYSENFDERAYTNDEIESALTQAGLKILETRDFYTNSEPTDTSEKIIYVVKKENNNE